ncbi:hypothetical protein M9H77_28468 [Catharanthus roseus]|uniref:Uncharacterized protein n=1 Tax=Catharanthus roseus TaxID=4058 RepID=A0ACC0AHC8_CATRO|nr:hypothetical protein M9H77_28468 [Catharanthus roseus]
MITGLCNGGLLKVAKELLAKMTEIACCPDEVTYSIIVQGYVKGGEDADAVMYLEEMDRKGFLLDASTLGKILDLLPSKGNDHILHKAIQNFNHIKKPTKFVKALCENVNLDTLWKQWNVRLKMDCYDHKLILGAFRFLQNYDEFEFELGSEFPIHTAGAVAFDLWFLSQFLVNGIEEYLEMKIVLADGAQTDMDVVVFDDRIYSVRKKTIHVVASHACIEMDLPTAGKPTSSQQQHSRAEEGTNQPPQKTLDDILLYD